MFCGSGVGPKGESGGCTGKMKEGCLLDKRRKASLLWGLVLDIEGDIWLCGGQRKDVELEKSLSNV